MRLIYLLLFTMPLVAEEPKNDVAKLSEAVGHLIGKNLQTMGLPIDMNALVRGMKDSCDGKEAPLSEDECMEALATLQEEALSQQAIQNLAEANEFLAQNLKQNGIISLENGKVQYKVVKGGSGQAVQPYNSPLIRYKGSYLDGQAFGSSSGDEMISLDETIDGFSKGIIGMKEGEVRTLYVHPDFGYGSHGLSMPNALLVFEVELVLADASANAQAASNAEDDLDHVPAR